ncbi:MAG: HAD family hydrolase [Sedimentibacter sp.]
MFKAAIFDLDGTLLDSVEDLERACNYALSKFNLPQVDSQKYKLMLGHGRRKIIESIVAEFFGYEHNEVEEKFLEYYNEYYDVHMFDNTKPFEGIMDMLDELNNKNIITAVLSNKPHDFTLRLCERFFNDKIKYSSGLKDNCIAKPDPSSLLGIIDDLNLKKEECIYIGDTEIDIQVAKNAGIKSLGVLWGFRTQAMLEHEEADYIASNIHEMIDIILKI